MEVRKLLSSSLGARVNYFFLYDGTGDHYTATHMLVNLDIIKTVAVNMAPDVSRRSVTRDRGRGCDKGRGRGCG